MRRKVRHATAGGFTLIELLVVIGLIAVLLSLIVPVSAKARAAAKSTTCLSNLRQMGAAWTIYLTENRGRLPEYVAFNPGVPELAWRGYWPGILDNYGIKTEKFLCPVANEPMPINQPLKGAGTVNYAWTGNFMSAGTVGRLSANLYRDGSYGYNRYLTVEGGFGSDGLACSITSVRRLSEVPAFFDATYFDAAPKAGSALSPVEPPPDLSGSDLPPSQEHWRFLISRHGRGINVAMADGSARWVPLEETYMLIWKSSWQQYHLELPLY